MNNRIKELEKILKEASEAYYNTDKKIMSDEEFDKLELEYQNLTGEKYLGALPSEGKGTVNVDHKYEHLVGTLAKAKNIDELEEWFNKLLDKYNFIPNIRVTLKYDGNSIEIEYDEKGKVIKALTRGRNGKGMDLTHVFKDHHSLEVLNNCGIKYEAMVTTDCFEALCEQEGISYANERSLIAGILGRNEASQFSDYVSVFPLWVQLNDDEGDTPREEQLKLLEEEFGDFYTEYIDNYSKTIIGTLGHSRSVKDIINEIQDHVDWILEQREDLNFMIDGIVIELLDDDLRKKEGYTSTHPKWAIALKFPPLEKQSEVVGFDYCSGDSGRITPRVWFKPIKFNGTTHRKQSLNNYKRFLELKLSIGSDIIVTYRNDCLSYVEALNTEKNKKLLSEWKEPEIKCPICGSKAVPNTNKTFLFCPNPKCEGKIVGKCQNFLTKMDIKGVKENMLEAFRDNGLLNCIKDLFTMDYDKIKNIPRMGEKVANNTKKAIQSKIYFDYEILGSVGIRNCSLETAKDICKNISLEELVDIYNSKGEEELINRLVEIEGISFITADYIVEGINENKIIIDYLIARKKNYKIYKDELNKNKNENIKQLTIVFSGFRDKDLKSKLELMGHKVTGSVSSKTDILVTPNPDENSTKIKKAKELGKEILTPEDFKNKYLGE